MINTNAPMNKHKSKERNVHSQAKPGPNNLGFHHQVTKSESLDEVGRHGLRWHGRVDQSWFDCLGFPMINTPPPGFWFSQSPSNAHFLALLPFASHFLVLPIPVLKRRPNMVHHISSWCSVSKAHVPSDHVRSDGPAQRTLPLPPVCV